MPGWTDLLDESSDRFAALVRWDSHDDRVVADRPISPDWVCARVRRGGPPTNWLAAGSGDADAAVARDAPALLGRLAGGGDRKLHRLRLRNFGGITERECVRGAQRDRGVRRE